VSSNAWSSDGTVRSTRSEEGGFKLLSDEFAKKKKNPLRRIRNETKEKKIFLNERREGTDYDLIGPGWKNDREENLY